MSLPRRLRRPSHFLLSRTLTLVPSGRRQRHISSSEQPPGVDLIKWGGADQTKQPSPTEKKSFWQRTPTSTTSSNHRSLLSDNEPFSISRESFESYRRSFVRHLTDYLTCRINQLTKLSRIFPVDRLSYRMIVSPAAPPSTRVPPDCHGQP